MPPTKLLIEDLIVITRVQDALRLVRGRPDECVFAEVEVLELVDDEERVRDDLGVLRRCPSAQQDQVGEDECV